MQDVPVAPSVPLVLSVPVPINTIHKPLHSPHVTKTRGSGGFDDEEDEDDIMGGFDDEEEDDAEDMSGFDMSGFGDDDDNKDDTNTGAGLILSVPATTPSGLSLGIDMNAFEEEDIMDGFDEEEDDVSNQQNTIVQQLKAKAALSRQGPSLTDTKSTALSSKLNRFAETDEFDNDDFGDMNVTGKSSDTVAVVIIVEITFSRTFFFYCLLCNHSFSTNPNSSTNLFNLFSFYYNNNNDNNNNNNNNNRYDIEYKRWIKFSCLW